MSRRLTKAQQARLDAARAKQAQLKARLREKKKQTQKKKKRWPWLLLLLLLLLLAMLSDCSCAEAPEEVPEAPVPVAGPAAPPEQAAPPPKPLRGRMARRDRPEYDLNAAQALPWLGAFRLQVSARSPRLAECFVGANQPGALRWSTFVEPSTGKVSQNTLEPVKATDTLTFGQRDCVLAVLAAPDYRLPSEDGRSTPSRVSMVIEF
ncbi:MAG: hypothetical protein AAFV53_38205 [Myxococcota bacterium]